MARVTMEDIARITGYSLSTVSRSLNNHPGISTETKRRITEVAREHGFAVNMRARSLATNRNSTIGIIYAESLDNENNFHYAGRLQASVRSVLEREQIDSLVAFTRNRLTGESNISRLIGQQKVDGILLIQPEITIEDAHAVRNAGIPVVLLHFLPRELELADMDYFYSDHVHGGYLATDHLIRRGAHRIVCITERERQFVERTEGFRAAHRDHGIPVDESLIYSRDASYDAGYELAVHETEVFRHADAVFAQSDIVALGLTRGLREAGIRIPDDILLAGYDDIGTAALVSPSLTTVRQPHHAIASRACEHLVRKLQSTVEEPVEHVILEPRLIVRESSGPALPEEAAAAATEQPRATEEQQ